MKEFLEPEFEIIRMDVVDVITDSTLIDGEDDLGWS